MDANDHEIDWERLDQYVTGRGTPEELDALERWVNANPTLGQLANAMRTVGQRADSAESSWDERSAWTRLQQKMHEPWTRPLRIARSVQRGWPDRSPRWAGLAAAAIIVVVGATITMRVRERPTAVDTASLAKPREIATGRGERATVDLADGSHVVLGPESRLVIPVSFNTANALRARELTLYGEATFHVVHYAGHPFRVRAMNAVIADVGTRFDVRAYAEDSIVSVAVTEGSVILSHPRPQVTGDTSLGVVLRRGDVGRVRANGQSAVVRAAHLAPYVRWTEGTLVFESAPLPEVVHAIGRWYDIDVRVPDPTLAARLVSAHFSTQSPEGMLDALATAVDARVERNGRVVTLVPK